MTKPQYEKPTIREITLTEAVAAEREACAKVAEDHFQYAGKEIAAAIRARKP